MGKIIIKKIRKIKNRYVRVMTVIPLIAFDCLFGLIYCLWDGGLKEGFEECTPIKWAKSFWRGEIDG